MINPAVTAALLAASQDEESEEFIQKKLREANAEGSSSAIRLELNEKQERFLDKALEQGTVVKTIDGRLYLNERALSERKEGQGYMALLILLVIGSMIASVAILALRSGG
ncbi:MAG TPA: hypothetical protein VL336_01955 [Sphingomicrobium sp.]|jgi:hypothetical protein|nr:hypothetical protein [Sphingomicrobium sp.]